MIRAPTSKIPEGDTLTSSHHTVMIDRPGRFVRIYRFASVTQHSLEVEFRPDAGDVIRIATIHKTKGA